MPSASASPKGTKATPKKGGSKAQGLKAQGAKTQGTEPRASKAHVFLIAVKRRREALRVYAVLTSSEAVALAIVESESAEDAAAEPVGRLSKKLARPLRLLTGEPRLI